MHCLLFRQIIGELCSLVVMPRYFLGLSPVSLFAVVYRRCAYCCLRCVVDRSCLLKLSELIVQRIRLIVCLSWCPVHSCDSGRSPLWSEQLLSSEFCICNIFLIFHLLTVIAFMRLYWQPAAEIVSIAASTNLMYRMGQNSLAHTLQHSAFCADVLLWVCLYLSCAL